MRWSSSLLGAVSGTALLALSLATSAVPAGAQFQLPSLPDPGRIGADAAAHQIAPYIQERLPVQLNAQDVYPTVSALPGGAFHPSFVSTGALATQLSAVPNGVANLAPGDYSLPVRVYCTRHSGHARSPEQYLLAPLRGARRDVLIALYSRVAAARAPFQAVQVLSWSLQAGMRYGELPSDQARLVDRLIPDYRGELQDSFLDQVRNHWNSLGALGLPSFDSEIQSLGALGAAYANLQDARATILADSGDYTALSAKLAPRGPSSGPLGPAPWSMVAANVYMRMASTTPFGSVGEMQVRVIGDPSNAPVAVPLLDQIAYATNCPDCQPLTYNPEPTPPEDGGGSEIPS